MRVRIACAGSEFISLDSLCEFQGNLKELSTENYEKLKKEILELGFSCPFFVWRNDEKEYLLDGHQRLRTLKRMRDQENIEMPPTFPIVDVEATDLKEAKKKVLAFTSQYGEITKDGLYEFLNESGLSFSDIKDDFRFPEVDFEKFEKEFYDSGSEPVDGEDEVPETRKTSIKHGDLFQLGDHRLLCGDSTDLAQVEKLMGGEKADMVYTDPPYGIGFESTFTKPEGALGGRKIKHNHFKILHGDDAGKNFNPSHILSLFCYCDEIFLWGADNYCWHLPKSGGWICWDKTGGHENLDNIPGSSFELCWSNHSHKRHIIPLTWRGTFGHNKKTDGDSKVHPTQKPVKLAEWFFDHWGNGKKNIVDLYLGSGSTLIACEKTKRRCFGMEIDPEYCQVIIDRWEKFAGQKAILVTGEKSAGKQHEKNSRSAVQKGTKRQSVRTSKTRSRTQRASG